MLKDSLRKLRRKNRLSQEELADRLFVSRSLVAKWELGTRYPSDAMLAQIATLFGVEVKELIKGEEEHLSADRELSDCLPGSSVDTDASDAPSDEAGDEQLIVLLAGKISEFLRQLPVRDRKIFLRRYYYYDSISKIAGDFSLDVDTTRTVLSEIRSGLQDYFEKEGLH